jgi:hypothetical protein
VPYIAFIQIEWARLIPDLPYTSPIYIMPLRYYRRYFAINRYNSFGVAIYLASCPIAYPISGLEQFEK